MRAKRRFHSFCAFCKPERRSWFCGFGFWGFWIWGLGFGWRISDLGLPGVYSKYDHIGSEDVVAFSSVDTPNLFKNGLATPK